MPSFTQEGSLGRRWSMIWCCTSAAEDRVLVGDVSGSQPNAATGASEHVIFISYAR
jgi:hypothetical protein